MREKGQRSLLNLLLIMLLVLSGCGQGSVGGSSRVYSVDKIEADSVLILHAVDKDTVDYQATVTDQDTVQDILDIYHTMKVRQMSKPMDFDRFELTFYLNGEEVTTWGVNAELVTAGSGLEGGNHVIENPGFDYDYLRQLYESQTGADQ